MGTSNKFGKYAPPKEDQPKNSVNIYIGMFFDGTGNNRFNSDKTYYSHIKDSQHRIIANTIPSDFSFTNVIVSHGKNIDETIKVADNNSYWNPYSNVAKLFDLYKERHITDEDEKNPEYGRYAILKQYIEGIGTKRDKADDFKGSGFARGNWGVISRVEEGIENLVHDQFKYISADKKINKIVFDVFGFSRGAAAARHFSNEVSKKAIYTSEMKNDPYDKFPLPTGKIILSSHAGGLLGVKLQNAGYKPVGETFAIEIRFLGLFDTVISDLIIKENLGYKLGIGGAISPLAPFASLIPLAQETLPNINTDISELRIGKVFHIKAQTEWRKNFAFTPSEQGYTLGMLGSHSDIGGGYAELDKYEPVLSFFDIKVGDENTLTDMQKFKQFYISSWICKEPDKDNYGIKFHKKYEHVNETTIIPSSMGVTVSNNEIKVYGDFPDQGKIISENPLYQVYQEKKSDHYILQDSRYISNKYSLIPMYLMLEKALKYKVPFHEDYTKAPDVEKKFEYELPKCGILKEYFDLMQRVSNEEDNDNNGLYEIPTQMYAHICNNYIHLSANFGGFKNDYITVATGDHNIWESVLFLNQPVEPIIKDGKVIYQREIYPSPH